MFDAEFLERAILYAPIIILALSVHEFAHAWSALKFGDDTATRLGRLTLNPLAHLDLMGSLVMVMTGFRFGWAKPVPVNLMNVRNYRVADFWISFAGPISNIGQAIVAAILYHIIPFEPGSYLDKVLFYAVQINLVLAFFNMIPLFPLDGSHMLRSILPREYEEPLSNFEKVGPVILLAWIILPNYFTALPPIFVVFEWLYVPIIRLLLF